MTYTLYDVRPVSKLGLPKLKLTAERFSIFFPSPLAADLKLRSGAAVNVRLGRNPQNKPALLRIYPAQDGAFSLQAQGRGGAVALSLPELRPTREDVELDADYVVESDGSISVELPQPWTLRSERALSRDPVQAAPI